MQRAAKELSPKSALVASDAEQGANDGLIDIVAQRCLDCPRLARQQQPGGRQSRSALHVPGARRWSACGGRPRQVPRTGTRLFGRACGGHVVLAKLVKGEVFALRGPVLSFPGKTLKPYHRNTVKPFYRFTVFLWENRKTVLPFYRFTVFFGKTVKPFHRFTVNHKTLP